jgi:hypothetical protein
MSCGGENHLRLYVISARWSKIFFPLNVPDLKVPNLRKGNFAETGICIEIIFRTHLTNKS